MITKPELVAIGCSERSADRWLADLNASMDCFGVDTPLRAAAFLAQVCHESGLLTIVEENLRYSEAGLLKGFSKYFNAEQAALCAKHPEMIANRAYASRMGNGDVDSGDGWRFRGRGLIQLTGRDNYKACSKALSLDLIAQPDLLSTERPAAMSAGWFWESRGLSEMADLEQFERITRAINGGLNGQAERLELYSKAKDALGV